MCPFPFLYVLLLLGNLVLSVGQEIEAKVVDFNGQDHKISLSMKALESAAPKYDDMATIGDMMQVEGEAAEEAEPVEEAAAPEAVEEVEAEAVETVDAE